MSLSARDATTADYGVFARLFPALQVPDPLLTEAQFEEQMLPNVVIAEDGEPVGYAHWRFYGATVHVVHLVVDTHARRRGAGRLLMEEVRRRAVAKGCARWYLNVKADNVPAIQLYERTGLSVEQRGWSIVADWSALKMLEGSTGLVRFEPSAEEASQFAREHRIDPERLALVRGRSGVVFVALRDDTGMCALAAFDPAFPGIYPIAVTRPGYARPLFEALFPYARQPHVNIFVEGNDALSDALRNRGAKLHSEIFRMGAPLRKLACSPPS
jgi:ribosomal protein S18 acetylase RimI-like enzyme